VCAIGSINAEGTGAEASVAPVRIDIDANVRVRSPSTEEAKILSPNRSSSMTRLSIDIPLRCTCEVSIALMKESEEAVLMRLSLGGKWTGAIPCTNSSW
jgi:hypothetical protein